MAVTLAVIVETLFVYFLKLASDDAAKILPTPPLKQTSKFGRGTIKDRLSRTHRKKLYQIIILAIYIAFMYLKMRIIVHFFVAAKPLI